MDGGLGLELVDCDFAGALYIWNFGQRRSVVSVHTSLTLQFGDVHAKGIALLQHSLSAPLDELVEAHRELRHTLTQVIEAEVDAWECVCHRWRACAGVYCLRAGEGVAKAAGCQCCRRHVVIVCQVCLIRVDVEDRNALSFSVDAAT